MPDRQTERRLLPLFMRQIMPQRMQKTKLTLTGWMLIIVALGIGSAAYNTASNILFMTLSLLLSSLILSGFLSLINFKKLYWSLKVPEHLQVGEVGMAEVDLENQKRVFPSMSIGFVVGSSDDGSDTRIHLKHAVRAQESAALEWTFVPHKRGRHQVYLHGVESKFPFGFLLKSIGQTIEESVLVWPERADYDFSPATEGRRFLSGASVRNAGVGSDLLNLRHYVRGDAPRLIHWKATARLNKLVVRQLAQEGESGFHIWLDPTGAEWSELQFEQLCSTVCALAEDLFHMGRLETICIGEEAPIAVRGLRELHDAFDLLALLPRPDYQLPQKTISKIERRDLITFKPLGEGGVSIHVNGAQAGQA